MGERIDSRLDDFATTIIEMLREATPRPDPTPNDRMIARILAAAAAAKAAGKMRLAASLVVALGMDILDRSEAVSEALAAIVPEVHDDDPDPWGPDDGEEFDP